MKPSAERKGWGNVLDDNKGFRLKASLHKADKQYLDTLEKLRQEADDLTSRNRDKQYILNEIARRIRMHEDADSGEEDSHPAPQGAPQDDDGTEHKSQNTGNKRRKTVKHERTELLMPRTHP